MLSRFIFILITLFWVLMNVLLWRAEYGRGRSAKSSVPASLVWQKMLTAPDSSSLTILHHGEKIGFCHWTTSIGEKLSQLEEGEIPAESLAERKAAHRLQLEGNLALESIGRLRFEGDLTL